MRASLISVHVGVVM